MGVDLGMDGELFPFKLRDYQKIPIHFIKRIVFLINNNWILFYFFVLFCSIGVISIVGPLRVVKVQKAKTYTWRRPYR